jgi:predicted esterase
VRRIAALAMLALVLIAAGPACSAAEVKTSAGGMTYSIRLPPGHDPAKPTLLVLGFHGWGGNHDQFMRYLALGELQDVLGRAILVTCNAMAGAAWEESDLPLVVDLLKEVKKQYKVARTIGVGFSRGAYFSFALGLRYPSDVQAVIPCSGGLVVPIPEDPAAKKQLFYVIHGDADGTVNVEQSREAVKALQGAGVKNVKYDEIKGQPHLMHNAALKRGFAWIEEVLGPAILSPAEEASRLAKLKKDVQGKDAAVAIAAAASLGEMGSDGALSVLMQTLEKVEKAKKDDDADLEKALHEALAKASGGESYATAKDWKKWAAGRGKKRAA